MDSYTIPEAAEQAGVSARAIREAIERGRLRAFREAGRWQIPDSEIERVELLETDSIDVEDIEDRLADIERRLEALETDSKPAGRATMRPALAHLFNDASPAPAPEVEPTVRSLGASRILGRLPEDEEL